jgi:hypothetical protein
MAKEIGSFDFRTKRGANVRDYRRKYDWDTLFGNPVYQHKTWELTQDRDFPDTTMPAFRQTLRNAANRRRVKYRTVKKDAVTVILEVLGPED